MLPEPNAAIGFRVDANERTLTIYQRPYPHYPENGIVVPYADLGALIESLDYYRHGGR